MYCSYRSTVMIHIILCVSVHVTICIYASLIPRPLPVFQSYIYVPIFLHVTLKNWEWLWKIVSFPDPTLKRERVWGHLSVFVVLRTTT